VAGKSDAWADRESEEACREFVHAALAAIGTPVGLERVREWLLASPDAHAEIQATEGIAAVMDFAGALPLRDVVRAFAGKRKDGPEPG
jgi:hypothetical protein